MEKLLQKMFNTTEYDVNQINDLAYYLRDYYKLNDYVKNFKYRQLDGNGLYMVDDKVIILDFDSILQSSMTLYRMYSDEYRINLQRFYLINIIITLLHELCHANQSKIADENEDDTLHTIIREGIDLGKRSPYNLTPDEKRLDMHSHNKILTERNAIINSYNELLILNELNLLGIDELKFIIDKLNEWLSKGYYVYKNPAKIYFSLRNKRDVYNELDFNDKDYDLYTKLSWGFPVDRSIIKERDKLKLLKKEE